MRQLCMAVLVLTLGSSASSAATLRMGALAPAGTAWAREMVAFAHDVETQTAGSLKIKWYLGGITGDERAMIERTSRGQLDGLASTSSCELLAPSWRALSAVGLFRSRNEATFVMRHIANRLADEFHAAGYVLLGFGGLGQDVIFSRLPFHSLADLRNIRLWIWDASVMARAQYPALGLHTIPGNIHLAAGLYDGHQVDGFIALPTAALAYQWSQRARYFAALPLDQFEGCLVVSQRAMDSLPVDQQNALRAASAKFSERFELTNAHEERAMLDGLLQHQGLKAITVSPAFLQAFFSEAKMARGALDPRVVNTSLIHEIEALLVEYRHGARPR